MAFQGVPLAPPNSILGLALDCKNDPSPNKIDLCIGAYRDDSGKPVVLDVVRKAEKILQESGKDHEYLSQDGDPDFLRVSKELMFGHASCALQEGRIVSIQGISGTGSLRLACEFITLFMSGRSVYYPSTTWPNHPTILAATRIPMGTYRYLDGSGCALDFDGLIEDISNCPKGSIILLHNCAHNPSGVDPTKDQWHRIMDVMRSRSLFPFFDNAYQGFVTGSPDEDAFSVRLFEQSGFEMIVACSFAKNFGLYGERVGALHFVLSASVGGYADPTAGGESSSPTSLAAATKAVGSQLRTLSRAIYSTCPAYGARLVALVLGDERMKAEWVAQCKGMADRLNEVRRKLYNALVAKNVKGSWTHVIRQRGMFSYTGIPSPAVKRLKEEFHIYMLSDGRISLAGLNSSNIDRFVDSLLAVLGKTE